jgi:hypothetical protein
MVVVASWITQKVQGGAVYVTVDGQPLGEVLRKRSVLRKSGLNDHFLLDLRVHTTGVARRHRLARFFTEVSLEAGEGVLVIVRSAEGYLWPMWRSHPATVRLVKGAGISVPRSHLWRIGFADEPPGGTDVPAVHVE